MTIRGLNRSMTHMLQRFEVRQVVAELYELLEAYAPAWYTEELRKRLLTTLKILDEESGQPIH